MAADAAGAADATEVEMAIEAAEEETAAEAAEATKEEMAENSAAIDFSSQNFNFGSSGQAECR